jgi:hypothetical protein
MWLRKQVTVNAGDQRGITLANEPSWPAPRPSDLTTRTMPADGRLQRGGPRH